MSVSTASAGTLVASKPSVVIGAASSSVSLNVVDTFADNKITEVSPANTAVDLSGYSPWYFRTAPPDGVQGNALGTLISTDGYTKVGFLVFNDTYGTGLRNVVEETVKAAGGSCTYGCKGEGDEFPAGQTTFSAEVSGVLASKPDAIVVLAFDETKSIVPELKSQGWDMSKVYLSDGNTSDFSTDFAKGTLEGAQGTIPGADPDATFKDRAQRLGRGRRGRAAEGLLVRRRVLRRDHPGRARRGQGRRDRLRRRSRRTTRPSRAPPTARSARPTPTASRSSTTARRSGTPDLRASVRSTSENDPSSAFVGIYTYNGDNKNELTSTVEGSK